MNEYNQITGAYLGFIMGAMGVLAPEILKIGLLASSIARTL